MAWIPGRDRGDAVPAASKPSRTRPTRRPASPTVGAAVTVVVAAGAILIAAGIVWSGSSASSPVLAETASAASVVPVSSTDASATEAATSATETATTTAEATTSTTEAATSTTVVASVVTVGSTDVSAVAAEVVQSVVTVHIVIDVRGPGDLTGSGSGVIVDSDGLIVTNAHVVSEATEVAVTLPDGETVEAVVVGIDEEHDIAVVRVDAEGLRPIDIGSTGDLAVGHPVIAVGNPLGLEGGPSVTTGIVSALGRVLEDASVSLHGVIQTDAAITEGSSGGALLDADGRLIGVTTAVGVSSIGVEGIGFAIPVETVMEVVADILAA